MTQVITSIQEWQAIRQKITTTKNIGFVPTLGNLHIGHQSLLEKSKQQNEITVLSIYVNRTQFNDPKDFNDYPRTFASDIELAKNIGIDFIIMPEDCALYPDDYCYHVNEMDFSRFLEGPYRPGHFSGVLTIVLKLFQIVKPTRTYLGEKDYQQLELIRGMVKAFFLDVEIVACPTIREADNLPYSSRNSRLSSSERNQASKFPAIFFQKKSCEEITNELLNAGFIVDYIQDYQHRRYGAVKIGAVRLIDNYARI